MPDLTVTHIQACRNTLKSAEVESSKGGKFYKVTVSLDGKLDNCTCPGFGYRRRCRHVDELRLQLCGWDEQTGEEVQTPQQEMEAICPRCKGETTIIKIGV